uniref:Uncharacterized protein n=1 Tax=Anguilla anguilla TaxID=7936 RepID=A0A0E9SR29_ANGAN
MNSFNHNFFNKGTC